MANPNEEIEAVDKVVGMLLQYADFQSAIAVNDMARNQAKDAILTPVIKAQLAQLDEEFDGRTEEARAKLDQLKAEIQNAMVALPKELYKSIKVDGFIAIAKGGKASTTVDAETLLKGLKVLSDNYTSIAPEITSIIQMATSTTITPRSVVVQVSK
jgi:hypothetical protein